jgi:hypothetical protein
VPAFDPAAAQLLKPLPSVATGVVAKTRPEGKPAVIVSPVRRPPLALLVKPSVHSVRVLAACELGANETALGLVAATIVTLAFAALVSTQVLMLTVFAPVELVLVMPASVSEAAVLDATAQLPPPFASVTNAEPDPPEAVAEQFEKPLPSVTVAGFGTVVPVGKVTVTPSPACSAPVALVVKFAVQVTRAPAASEVADAEAPVGAVAAAIVVVVLSQLMSALVFTPIVLLPVEEELTTIEAVKETALLAATEHVPPLSASVERTSLPPGSVTVAEQLLKPLPSVTPRLPGSANPVGKPIVTVSPARSEPPALVVKLAVHAA